MVKKYTKSRKKRTIHLIPLALRPDTLKLSFNFDRSKLKVNFKVIEFVWKYHKNDLHGRLSNERINNHGLIMYTEGAREQNKLNPLKS